MEREIVVNLTVTDGTTEGKVFDFLIHFPLLISKRELSYRHLVLEIDGFWLFVLIGGVDYIGPDPLVLTFMSGQVVDAQRCAVISATDDSLIEDVETLSISLTTSPTDGDSVRFTMGESTTTVAIVQDPNDST